MKFLHSPYQPGETIAAVATPPGEGGISVIRVTGNQALQIVDKIFSGTVLSYATHTAHFGKFCTLAGEVLDEGLVLIMLGKRSFCGEDTVEINCHGGSLVTRKVLEECFKAGARPAKPGEFSFKAFMNGKIDLAQAEAIQELIGAKNEMAMDSAQRQLSGKLSQKIKSFQKKLVHIAAMLEAWVDFPEEDIAFAPIEEVCNELEEVQEEMKILLETFHDGKILHDGLTICLVGCPNVGKSSLMNALLDKERAIVTHLPGTTRDILEDHLRINGLNIRLLDTAGLRETEEVIEQEGIRRTKKAMKEADLVLHVLDIKEGLQAYDKKLLEEAPKSKTLAIWNKCDLTDQAPQETNIKQVIVSAQEKIGLEMLYKAIDAIIWDNGPPSKEEVIITKLRHKDALSESLHYSEQLLKGIQSGASPEFLSMDMRHSLEALGKIIGSDITEDILSEIFSTFCVGK